MPIIDTYDDGAYVPPRIHGWFAVIAVRADDDRVLGVFPKRGAAERYREELGLVDLGTIVREVHFRGEG